VQIVSLELFNFRNLSNQKLHFPEHFCFILGKNGQGKTSILEAIYLLSAGKSFRGAKPPDLVKWPEKNNEILKSLPATSAELETCQIKGLIGTADGEKEILFSVNGNRRTIRINGEKVSSAEDFYGIFPVIEFTPDNLKIIKEDPAQRRQFFDRLLSLTDSAYLKSLVRYQKLLRNRNSILKSAKKIFFNDHSELKKQLNIWNRGLAEEGLILASKRLNLLNNFNEAVSKNYQLFLIDSPAETVKVEYESKLVCDQRLVSFEDYLRLLEENFEKDLRQQSTTVGVHRDDFIFSIDTGFGFKSARTVASQGQTRSIMLASKISAAEYVFQKTNIHPLLLLDDVESELDNERKNALFELLQKMPNQVVVTGIMLSDSVKKHQASAQVLTLFDGELQAS
jgi:DNA replication and repair protein RecF